MFGERSKPQDERLLTEKEFTAVANVMRARYRNMPPDKLMQTLNFSSVMYAWTQLGPDAKEEVNHWISSNLNDDQKFLLFLDGMRSWLGSSTYGIQYPIKASNISPFLDVAEVDQRLQTIAEQKNDSTSSKAKELIEARAIQDW